MPLVTEKVALLRQLADFVRKDQLPDLAGLVGPAGPRGFTGETGPRGFQGAPGPPGGIVSDTGRLYDMGGAFYNVLAYGADPTGVADSVPAVMAAIADFTDYGPTDYAGATIYFPPGVYRMASDLTVGVTRAVVLKGAGPGGWHAGATLDFDAGYGLVVTGVGTVAAVIEDLAILSKGPTVGPAGTHGVRMLKRTMLYRCRIAGFTGNGVDNRAAAGDGNNANGWVVQDCMIDTNGGYGMEIQSGDANAGHAIGNDVSGNTLGGIWDHSFLGNTYIGNHADGNGNFAYKSSGATNQSVWIGNYIEGGLADMAQIDAPSVWFGGIGGAHGVVSGTGARLVSAGSDSRMDNIRSTPLISWTALELGAGFANVGGTAETAQFQVDATATCWIKGEITGGTAYIAALPQKPIKDQRFLVAIESGGVHDVATVEIIAASGQMSVVSGNVGAGHRVSLDIQYKTV